MTSRVAHPARAGAGPRWRRLALPAAGLAAALLWSAAGTGFRPWVLARPEALAGAVAFVRGMLPPDLSPAYLRAVGWAALQTLAISAVSTLLAAGLGLALGLLAVDPRLHGGLLAPPQSARAAWGARLLLYYVSRAALGVLRSIPELFWALVFVVAIGLGPFPGVLALGLHTAGVLGKLYAEVVEVLDPRPLEALKAAGASRAGVLLYGALPQMLPAGVSYTLYRWEINIREASVLGFVGAGGLGYELYVRMNLFHTQQLATLVLAVFVLVTLVDAASAAIRRRLA
ncbi:MAG TPA: phosphonate ABC transporter, permease protein PhnE [Thermodesulfobacteriota bacterium]|nr:phosphonate ABC transporter, permease protein PhnE [Thermodesulfobacteriota bacterium]